MENFSHQSATACPDQMNYWAANSNFPLTWLQQTPAPHVNSSASTSNSNSNSIDHHFHELPYSWSNINPMTQEVAEDRATAVSKSHSQAEKRRRDRINAQLATLRKLIPKSEKVRCCSRSEALKKRKVLDSQVASTWYLHSLTVISADGQGSTFGKCDRACEGPKAKSNGSEQNINNSNGS